MHEVPGSTGLERYETPCPCLNVGHRGTDRINEMEAGMIGSMAGMIPGKAPCSRRCSAIFCQPRSTGSRMGSRLAVLSAGFVAARIGQAGIRSGQRWRGRCPCSWSGVSRVPVLAQTQGRMFHPLNEQCLSGIKSESECQEMLDVRLTDQHETHEVDEPVQ